MRLGVIFFIVSVFFSAGVDAFSGAKMRRARHSCIDGSAIPGQVCPGGAIFLGVFSGGKYMVTPGGCTNSTSPTCSGGVDSVTRTWRGSTGSNVAIAGLDATVTSTGMPSVQGGSAATAIIVADASVSSDSAAGYCEAMIFGGYTDWFLPAKSELALLFCRASVASHNPLAPQEDPNCVSFGGKISKIAGIPQSSIDYWTSTQHGTNADTSAWFMNFSTGVQGSGNKSGSRYVRCVRRY